jgi:hypothetical protein
MNTQIKHRTSEGKSILAFVLVLAIAGTAGYFYLYPETLPEWAGKTSVGRDLQTTTVYKWKDASGKWQVSDQPPPKGVEYQTESYHRDTNIVPLPPELTR